MKKKLIFLLLIFNLIAVCAFAQTIHYVTPDGTGDGTSWANASGSIAAMITASTAGSGDQIWVAGGDYPLAASIAPKNGVHLYGGFAGTETAIEQRAKGSEAYDFLNPTILDGQGTVRVMNQASSFATETVIDGFTITNGFITNGSGAGINMMANGKLLNCIVIDNHVVVTSSTAGVGAGINMSAGATVSNCKIADNTITTESGSTGGARGAGIRYSTSATGGVTVTNCLISGNQIILNGTGAGNGGAIYGNAQAAANAYMSNCVVINNSTPSATTNQGGGVWLSYTDVVNCTFANNTGGTGGGVYCYSGMSCTVTNSIVWGNTATASPQVMIGTGSVISYSAIQGGFTGTGNISLDATNDATDGPLFADPATDNYRLLAASPCIDAGDNSVVTEGMTDLDGNERIFNDIVDMGAYEYQVETVSNIRYVKTNGTGDGTSWANASGNIQTMINDLQASGGEVWVASGAYPLAASIALRNGVHLYGGFIGTETAIVQRAKGFEAWEFQNPTILDGQGTERVMNQASNFAVETVIDGFTITNGFINTGNGAGINMMANGKLLNCIVANNHALVPGASPVLGAGINMSAGATVSNCKIADNTITSAAGSTGSARGAGIRYSTSATGGVTVTNCLISGNQIILNGTSAGNGGGIYGNGQAAANAYISNCVVINNSTPTAASNQGGGVWLSYTDAVNCTFANNTGGTGGGVYCYSGMSCTVTNSIVWGNTATASPQVMIGTGSVISYSAIQGGFTGTGNINLDATNDATDGPLFADPTTDNYRLQESSPCIDAGNNDPVTEPYDLDGNERIFNDIVDMGAYEYMPSGFIPVTNITNVPTSATTSIPFTLTGTVVPSNATNKTIVWTVSVNDAGTTGATINGNIFNATTAGTATITATIENGAAEDSDYTQDFTITVTGFISVTNITNVPLNASAFTPLTLTGTVVPSNATNQTIVWSVENAGTTGATITGGSIFNATAAGTAQVKATIVNGTATGDYTQNFNITVTVPTVIPVTNITNVPSSANVGTPLTLTGTVVPENATNQTIVWSVVNAGTTGATITGGSIFNATAAGTAQVKATIANGVDWGEPYEQNFNITVILPAQNVRYVKPGGTGDGTSWANASGNIQTMINVSGVNQVWVAGGSYPLTASIAPKSGVQLYGGFAGTETSIAERAKGSEAYDFLNPTILDGQGNIRVVNQSASFTVETVIDGFTITNGFITSGNGAGINMMANCKLLNCIVIDNHVVVTSSTTGAGAGVNMSAGATVSNCKIADNTITTEAGSTGGARGAGIRYSTSAVGGVTVTNCLISGNKIICYGTNGSTLGTGNGGAIYGNAQAAANAYMSNCVVINNSVTATIAADAIGGGVWLSYTDAVNCTFANNTAGTFANNAAGTGGGVYCYASMVCTVTNSIIWGNKAATGPQIVNGVVTYNAIEGGGVAGEGNITLGDDNEEGNGPLFVDPAADDYRLQVCSPCSNKGENSIVTDQTDYDGNPRIFGETVDMGAFELQAESIVPEVPSITLNGLQLVSDSPTDNQWYLNGVAIPGATQQTYQWIENGQYFVKVTNSMGCSASSNVITTNYVAVTNITNLPSVAATNSETTLTGTIVPENATMQDIVWSIEDAGTTGATITGNIFYATATGTVAAKATIINGATTQSDYEQPFTITVTDYFPVTNITGVPSEIMTYNAHTIDATVIPENASFQNIIWSIEDAGSTQAVLNGNTIRATAAGVVVLKATIINGATEDTPYIQEFNIRVNASTQVPRSILIEGFTASTCPPCLAGNINLKNVLEQNQGLWTLIKYQMYWPGVGDPYFTEEGRSRQRYYEISGVPHVKLEGVNGMNSASVTNNYLNNLQAVPANMELDVEYYVVGQTVHARVKVNSTINRPASKNLRLYMAVVEKKTYKNKKSNGETEFEQVMKKFMPDSLGIELGSMDAFTPYVTLQEWEFKGNYRLPTDASDQINHDIEHSVEDFNNLTVVAWVQEYDTKVICQSLDGNNSGQPVVTFGAYSGGTVSATIAGEKIAWGTPLNTGDVVSFTAHPFPGYVMKHWLHNGEMVSENTSTQLTIPFEGDYIDVTAVFEQTSCQVTFATVNNFGTLTATADGTPITSGATVNGGAKVVFTATPDDNYKVKEWKENDNVVVDNTSTEYTIASLSGDVNVTVEFIMEDGINEPAVSNFKIYPNPGNDIVKVVRSTSETGKIDIYNSLGAWVQSFEISGTESEINVSSLSAGAYIIKLTTANQKISNLTFIKN